MSKGFGGPKPAEIRGGLGIDRNITSEIVPTASQVGAYSQADRQNVGYSGTPMWKIAQERALREQENAANRPVRKIPEGFMPLEKATAVHFPAGGQWYFSEKSQLFWNARDAKMYVWDSASRKHVELHESRHFKHRVSVGTCVHEEATQVRTAIVHDLAKAAQALRMSLEHLDRPCSLYSLYEGHNGSPAVTGNGNVSADFCSKNLQQKLLPKLAGFRGYWADEQLMAAVRETVSELDAELIEKHPTAPDGCSFGMALVVGDRIVLGSLGDVACIVCMRNGDVLEKFRPHAVPDPEDEDEDEEDESPAAVARRRFAAALAADPPPIRWTRSFGDLAYKAVGSSPRLLSQPDVAVLHVEPEHQGVAFICRALYNSIGRSMAVSTVFRRNALRPRMASGSLVDAAVQWLGHVGDLGLGSVVISLDQVEPADGPPSKKPRAAQPSQVRLRHLLLKHRECKSTVDKVRNKQVKRSRNEAERLLRRVLEECEGDVDGKIFTQKCKDMSECQSCLKAGDLVGDLGWQKPGKLGQAFDNTAFSLQLRQVSDLVDTDQGIHILLRSA